MIDDNARGPRPAPGAFAPTHAPRRIEDLQHRNAVLDAQIAETQRRIEATREALATAVGVGVGGRRTVQAAVDANNRLLDLLIEPEALRLGSIQALRNEVFEAVVNAQADVAGKVATAAGDLGRADLPDYGRAPELSELLVRDDVAPIGPLGAEQERAS